MGCCRDCMHYSAYNDANPQPLFSFKDGFCTAWLVNNSLIGYNRYKGVNSGDSCNKFRPYDNEKDRGFKKDCFLTSACVEYMNKADDCEELTALRAFRDTYVKNSVGGETLIEEYYKVAPAIVAKINESNKKDEYYQSIYSTIQICLQYIAENKKEEALQEYRAMVLRLQNI